MSIEFGDQNIITFRDNSKLYEAIGYLSNFSKRGLNISIESYNNKWGVEYRIWLKNVVNAPYDIRSAFSKGTQSYVARLNCNEFIHHLINEHCFAVDEIVSVDVIRATIPFEYIDDFDRGYNL